MDAAHLMELVRHLEDVLWECGFDGVLRDATPSMKGLLGWEVEELVAMDLGTVLAPGAGSTLEAALAEVLEGRHDAFRGVEVPFLHRDGREIWVELSGCLVRDDQGFPSHFQGLARDVTLRRQAEAALRQATKTQSLGLLAGGVAHDFNNLLQALMGHLEVLSFHTRTRPDLVQACERMMKVIRRAEDIAHRMESFAFGEEGAPEPQSLEEVLAGIQPLLRASLPSRITLKMDVEPGLPPARVERHGLTQVLLELAANSLQARDREVGTLQVRVGAQERSPFGEALWVLPRPAQVGVVLEVEDDGPGMEPALLARVFDPFFSTSLHGRGLGLATVQGRARSLGAGLRVCSAPGEGACFTLAFPGTGGGATS